MAEDTPEAVLIQLNKCLVNLQSIIKCSICCSTLRDPITPSCNHAFCKECLDSVFQRRTVIECPICRQTIKRRSARMPSEHVDSLVKLYLQLIRSFKSELKAGNPIPKDTFILESQAGTQLDDVPLRSITLQEPMPTITLRKKRKNEDSATNPPKVARTEKNHEFAVPYPLSEFNNDNKNERKYKSRGATARTLDLRTISTSNPGSILDLKKGESESILPTSSKENLSPTEKCAAKTFQDVSCGTETSFLPCTAKCTQEVGVEPKASSISTSVQCGLLTTNVDKLIIAKKEQDPKCTDIQAFFSIFPGTYHLFKSNMHELLQELGIHFYLKQHQSEHLKRPAALKFEIPVIEEDFDFNVSKRVFCENACQTKEVVLKAMSCQTEVEVDKEDVVPASEPEIQNKVDASCQTEMLPPDGHLNDACTSIHKIKEKPIAPTLKHTQNAVLGTGCQNGIVHSPQNDYYAKHSACSSVLSVKSEKNVTYRDATPTSEDIFSRDSECSEYSLPKKLIIVISRRQSNSDNVLLRTFKRTFENIQLRTQLADNTTHLVMMNTNDISCSNDRSLMYVNCITRRIEIVNRRWIEDCLKSGNLLKTQKYKLKGTNYLPWYAETPNEDDIKLFRNYIFYIPHKYFPPSCDVHRESIIQIIISAGGTVSRDIEDFSKKTKETRYIGLPGTDSSKPKHPLIVFSPFCRDVEAARSLSGDLNSSVVSADYILDSICNGGLLCRDKYLIQYTRYFK